MRKTLLRAGMLGVVVVVVMAMSLHFMARAQVEQLSQALQPWGSLSHAGIGITFDGRVRITSPRLRVQRGPLRGELSARVAYLKLDHPWAAHKAASADLPATLDLDLHAPVWLPGMDQELDRILKHLPRLAAATGCFDDTAAPLAESAREPHARLSYRMNGQDLQLQLMLAVEPFPSWQLATTLSGLRTSRIGTDASPTWRVQRLELAMMDSGYLAERNRTCARTLGLDADAVIERQLDTVVALLNQHDIEANETVIQGYRRWLGQGGRLALTSLPDASLQPDGLSGYPRDALWRLLNVTLRHQDLPPIMLGMAFRDPDRPLLDAAILWEAPAQVVASSGSGEVEDPADEVETSIAGHERAPEAQPVADPTTDHLATGGTATITPAAVPAEAITPDPTANDDDVAQTAPLFVDHGMPPPSTARPPENSTLALVWNESIFDRLPESVETERGTRWILVTDLSPHVGARVQVTTGSGRHIEGRVAAVDDNLLHVSVRAESGEAVMALPIASIQQARIIPLRQRMP